MRASRGRGHVGATTEIAALATFLLGAVAGAGHLTIAGATGVGVAVLLAAKPRIEGFTRALTAEEVSAALELAVITVIVLPLLPDKPLDPWGILSPREIWIVVVLVSALSFAGFIAVRVLGEQRGTLVTGGRRRARVEHRGDARDGGAEPGGSARGRRGGGDRVDRDGGPHADPRGQRACGHPAGARTGGGRDRRRRRRRGVGSSRAASVR